MDVIKVEKLDFSYGNKQILKKIDLDIKSKNLLEYWDLTAVENLHC